MLPNSGQLTDGRSAGCDACPTTATHALISMVTGGSALSRPPCLSRRERIDGVCAWVIQRGRSCSGAMHAERSLRCPKQGDGLEDRPSQTDPRVVPSTPPFLIATCTKKDAKAYLDTLVISCHTGDADVLDLQSMQARPMKSAQRLRYAPGMPC